MAFVPTAAITQPPSRQWHLRTTSTFGCNVYTQTSRKVRYVTRNQTQSTPTTMQSTDVKSHEVFMPALSSTMTEGKIVQWLKRPGDAVSTGDPIMVVESDKADMDVESFDNGFLATILVDEGESCPVGEPVALIVDSKEDIDKVQAPSPQNSNQTSAPPDAVTSPPHSAGNGTPDPAPPPVKPNFTEIVMPALSSTMTEGKIVEWLKAEGDIVEMGDMVMVVESDKADMDVEAFDSGLLAHISVPSGSSAPVGSPVAFLVKSPDEVAAVKTWASLSPSSSTSFPSSSTSSTSVFEEPSTPEATIAPSPSSTSPEHEAPKVVNDGRIIASPWAKTVAKEQGVDLRYVVGTGPGGRIVERDVLKAKANGAPTRETKQAPAPAQVPAATSGKIIATPDAKKIAKKEGVDLSSIKGTGNFGRITAEDVLRATGKVPAAVQESTSGLAPQATRATKTDPKLQEKVERNVDAPTGAVAMNSLQKAVVSNMNASLTVPVFRLTYKITTTALDELYVKVKPKGVTMSALLAKAVAITLRKHPIMNAAYADSSVVYREDINVAMAVSTPDGGLITPTLMKADETDLYSLSRTWKDLVKRASDKKLSPKEYTGGTFTISNLGMFGVEQFDAILPPGVPGILAVAAAQPTVQLLPSGLIGVQKVMNVTLTADHRHIYGADGARFLRDLAKLIESDIMELLM